MRRYSEAVKADVRRRMTLPHRQSVSPMSEDPAIHPRDHPLRMEEEVAVAGRSGAGIREGTRRLERCLQVHGGAGDGRVERHRAQRLLPRAPRQNRF